MNIFGFKTRQKSEKSPGTRASIEDPTVPVSADNFYAFFGLQSGNLAPVNIDTALQVPAVLAAVAFLSRTLAALPRHAYRSTKEGAKRVEGKLEIVVNAAPNETTNSFKFWQYFWQQVFTGGRGLAWIEKTPQGVEALWAMDPAKTTVSRKGFAVTYEYEGKVYPAADVIDVPFMLHSDGLRHYGPIMRASKAIQLALAMNDYGSNFFAGGGVPPLALKGPLPTGTDAIKRAQADIKRSVDAAKNANEPIFPIPPGYDLNPVGLDPAKGQMIEARRFQVEEIARAWQLPPVFLQELSRATFSNAEQQDLHLVKHLIGQWAKALEDEMNLKMFGRGRGARYVEHNLDGLMRGDFKSRIEGLSQAVQNALLTPNEARALENRPEMPNGDDLLVQGATVPLGSQPMAASGAQSGAPADPGAADPNAANDNQQNKANAA